MRGVRAGACQSMIFDSMGKRVLLPLPCKTLFFIDFDGTITKKDVLASVIEQGCPDKSWKPLDAQYLSGEIGSSDCLRAQVAKLRLSKTEANAIVDGIPIDPAFRTLLALLRSYGIRPIVLSDGEHSFIRRFFDNHKLPTVYIRANTIEWSDTGMTIRCPWSGDECESAACHCKCRSIADLRPPGYKAVYVGDGRSDLCPARKADVVFAKATLAAVLKREGRSFLPFTTLADVVDMLSRAWSWDGNTNGAQQR